MSEMLLTARSNKPGASELVLVSGSTPTGFKVMDGYHLGNAVYDKFYSGMRGTQGARLAGSEAVNREVVWPLLVEGSSRAEQEDRWSTLSVCADEMRRYGGTVTWRPEGGDSVDSVRYFSVLDAEATADEFGYLYHHHDILGATLRLVCAPYADTEIALVDTENGATLPAVLDFDPTTTGDGPGLGKVAITHSGGAASPVFALIGWWERPQVHSLVWNGDFDLSTLAVLGWSVASVTNLNSGAATSITRTVATAQYGVGSGEVVCPANADRGAHFRIFRRFKSGVTYTARAYIQSAAAVTNVYIRLGNAAANDKATSSNTALTTGFQLITVTWTPSANRDDAHLAINIAAATATTFRIDGVEVYEGTTAPTNANQTQGRGGYPPVGILEGESSMSAVAPTGSANYRSGFGVVLGTQLYVLDPTVLVPDTHTSSQVTLEVWARVELIAGGTAPILLVTAEPISSTAGLPVTYTHEYGSAGKTLALPSAGTVRRFVRLGTLTLSASLGRVLLGVERTVGTNDVILDYLAIVPAYSRSVSPTGKVNNSTYPKFLAVTDQIRKTINSDLSATFDEPLLGTPEVPTHGLGGSLLEIPPGPVEMLIKLSSLVPDDPTSDATTEQLSHAADINVWLTRRWHLARSS